MTDLHTPAPWQTNGSVIETAGKTIATRICIMPHHGGGKSEVGEAVLCKMFAEQARAAIAKAKGGQS